MTMAALTFGRKGGFGLGTLTLGKGGASIYALKSKSGVLLTSKSGVFLTPKGA
jgi:hypothetical protein